MTAILHDPTWQFVINAGITIVLGTITSMITIWLALRKPSLPIGYETIDISSVSGAESTRDIKKKMHIPLNKKTPDLLCLLTLKIWNAGKEIIQLPHSTPLIISFGKGVKILGWDNLEKVPDYVEATPNIDNDKLELHLPILRDKQYITIRVLLTDNFTGFPDIYAKLPIKYKIIKANNVKRAREYRNFSIVMLFFSIFFLITILTDLATIINLYGLFETIVVVGSPFLFSFMLFTWSYQEKEAFPHHKPLPSEILKRKFKEFLFFLPLLIAILVIAFIIDHIFGRMVLVNCIMTLVTLIIPLELWFILYPLIEWLLKKFKIFYNKIILITLSLLVPLLLFLWLLSLIIRYFWF